MLKTEYKILKHLHKHETLPSSRLESKFSKFKINTLETILQKMINNNYVSIPFLVDYVDEYGQTSGQSHDETNYTITADGEIAVIEYKEQVSEKWKDRIYKFVTGYILGVITGLTTWLIAYLLSS